MTETIRYGLLGKEDMRTEPRGGTFEATLADGRVVNLHALDVAHFLGDAYATADVPDQSVGQIYRLTDGARGLWAINQAGAAFALSGQVLNVLEFGALGDDNDDQAAVAAAFAVSGGKTVYFPGPYTYVIDGINITADDTTVVLGAGAIVKRSDTVDSDNNYLFAVLANRVKFYGPGILDGNRSVLTGAQNMSGISLNHGDLQTADIEDILITGLTIRNMPNALSGQTGDGIRTPLDTATYTVRDLRIIGNTIRDVMRNGITLTNAKYVSIIGNQLRDCEQSHIDCEGVYASAAVKYVEIIGNTMRNTVAAGGRAIDAGMFHGLIKGNIYDGNNTTVSGGGILMSGGGDVLVEGNYLYNVGGDGIAVTTTYDRPRIRGNTFHTIAANAIDIASGVTGAEIMGNYIYNWNQTGGADRAAISASGGYAHISDNTMHKETGGTSSTGIGLGSSGNNRVGSNHYIGDILHRVSNRTGTDLVSDSNDIVAKTAQYTVSATNDFGKTFTNEGATGVFEFDLPASVVGLRYSFVRVASFAVRVDPNGSEVIRGGGAGKYLELDADGESVTLLCVAAGTWEIVAVNGSPAYEP